MALGVFLVLVGLALLIFHVTSLLGWFVLIVGAVLLLFVVAEEFRR